MVIRNLSHSLFEAVRKYFRIEVSGLEKLPRKGKLLIAPNHSGASGLDAVMLGYVLYRQLKRIPRILTVWKIFEAFPWMGELAQRYGLIAASLDNGVEQLKNNRLLLIFPEGEAGSFKPTSQRYRLQPFRTGFVRMAVLTGAPIVPALVIGAEESHINLGSIRLKPLRGAKLPIPLNLVPLPAKWRIKFLDPIHLDGYTRRDAANTKKMRELAVKIQTQMQKELDQELSRRPYVYFRPQSAA